MMSNEMKRDVFEDALRALEEFGEQGSSWEMAYDDLSAGYAAASDGDTDCPYCHEPHKLIESELGNFLRIGMTGGNEWDRIEPKKINGAAIHTCEAVGFDNAEVDDPIVINYCPMCGRRLEGKQ